MKAEVFVLYRSSWGVALGVSGLAPEIPPSLTDFPVTYVRVGVVDVISYLLGAGNSKARDFFISGTHVIIAGAIVSVGTALTGYWDWF